MSSLEYFLEKAIGELNKALQCAQFLNLPRFYAPRYGTIVLHNIRPFCLDYSTSIYEGDPFLTKQGFVFYLQRQDTGDDCSVTLCFYYDFRKGCLHHYFHPFSFKKDILNYDDVYAIAKSGELRDFVFTLPLIKHVCKILYDLYQEEPENEIVSEHLLRQVNDIMKSNGRCFYGYYSHIVEGLQCVLPKWRLDLIIDIHFCYYGFISKKEEPHVENVNENAAAAAVS